MPRRSSRVSFAATTFLKTERECEVRFAMLLAGSLLLIADVMWDSVDSIKSFHERNMSVHA